MHVSLFQPTEKALITHQDSKSSPGVQMCSQSSLRPQVVSYRRHFYPLQPMNGLKDRPCGLWHLGGSCRGLHSTYEEFSCETDASATVRVTQTLTEDRNYNLLINELVPMTGTSLLYDRNISCIHARCAKPTRPRISGKANGHLKTRKWCSDCSVCAASQKSTPYAETSARSTKIR